MHGLLGGRFAYQISLRDEADLVLQARNTDGQSRARLLDAGDGCEQLPPIVAASIPKLAAAHGARIGGIVVWVHLEADAW